VTRQWQGPALIALLLIAIAFIVAISLLPKNDTKPKQDQKKAPDKISVVIATVNEQPLRLNDVMATLAERVDLKKWTREKERDSKKLKAALIKRFGKWQVDRAFDRTIYQQLADQAIKEAGKPPAGADIDQRYRWELTAYKKKPQSKWISYEQALAQQGLTVEARKREIGRELGLDRIIGEPSQSDLQLHFKTLQAHFSGERRLLRHILLKDEKTAVRLRDELDKGASFEDFARKYSREKSTARDAGLLGWIQRRNDVPEALARRAFSLAKSRIAGPVKTVYGYHLIRVDKIQKGRELSLAKVRRQVRDDLMKEQRIAYMRKQRASAKLLSDW
jgi:parvulin-like peptidyl-prolyl isomerase